LYTLYAQGSTPSGSCQLSGGDQAARACCAASLAWKSSRHRRAKAGASSLRHSGLRAPHISIAQSRSRPVARPRHQRRQFLLSVAPTCGNCPSFHAPSQPERIADAPACAIAGPAQHPRQHHVALRVLAQCGHGKVRHFLTNMIHPTQQEYRQEQELAINIRKATSIEETAPKRTYLCAAFRSNQAHLRAGKHVRSCIVYTWDHKSSASFWQGMKVCVYTRPALPNQTRSTPPG
jgi:hypothetical protein